MTDSMSDKLDTIVKQTAEKQATALEIVSDAIGVASNIFGVIGGASAVVGLIALLKGADNTLADAIKDLRDIVTNGLTELKEIDGLMELQAKFDAIDTNSTAAIACLATLQSDLDSNPPVDINYKRQQVGKCIAALEFYQDGDSHQWQTDPKTQFYFTSSWSGTVAPSTDADGFAFSTRYAMPMFLRLIMIFMAVGGAFEPTFLADNGDIIRGLIDRLEGLYLESINGLITLREPQAHELYSTEVTPQSQGREVYITNFDGLAITLASAWQQNGQICGAVDMFSGLNSTQAFPAIGFNPVAHDDPDLNAFPPPPPQFFEAIFESLAVINDRSLSAVYGGLGLPAVRKSINILRTMIGSSPLVLAWQDWSVRELAKLVSLPGTHVSVRSLMRVLRSMSDDVAGNGDSLRSVLGAIPSQSFISALL